MIGKGAYEIRPATLAEVARILEKRQGMVGEFGFEQQTTLDYARRFSHLKLSDAQELYDELVKLDIKPEAAVKVVDILPSTKAQLALILAKDKIELSEKKQAAVEELVAKFSKKAKKPEPKAPAEPAPTLPEEKPAQENPEAQGKAEEKKEG